MKITQKMLRGLIIESMNKHMQESVGDMSAYQALIEDAAVSVSEQFGEDMLALYEHDPEIFQGRTSLDEWEAAVENAQEDLEGSLRAGMARAIATVESKLHDGQYQLPQAREK